MSTPNAHWRAHHWSGLSPSIGPGHFDPLPPFNKYPQPSQAPCPTKSTGLAAFRKSANFCSYPNALPHSSLRQLLFRRNKDLYAVHSYLSQLTEAIWDPPQPETAQIIDSKIDAAAGCLKVLLKDPQITMLLSTDHQDLIDTSISMDESQLNAVHAMLCRECPAWPSETTTWFVVQAVRNIAEWNFHLTQVKFLRLLGFTLDLQPAGSLMGSSTAGADATSSSPVCNQPQYNAAQQPGQHHPDHNAHTRNLLPRFHLPSTFRTDAGCNANNVPRLINDDPQSPPLAPPHPPIEFITPPNLPQLFHPILAVTSPPHPYHHHLNDHDNHNLISRSTQRLIDIATHLFSHNHFSYHSPRFGQAIYNCVHHYTPLHPSLPPLLNHIKLQTSFAKLLFPLQFPLHNLQSSPHSTSYSFPLHQLLDHDNANLIELHQHLRNTTEYIWSDSNTQFPTLIHKWRFAYSLTSTIYSHQPFNSLLWTCVDDSTSWQRGAFHLRPLRAHHATTTAPPSPTATLSPIPTATPTHSWFATTPTNDPLHPGTGDRDQLNHHPQCSTNHVALNLMLNPHPSPSIHQPGHAFSDQPTINRGELDFCELRLPDHVRIGDVRPIPSPPPFDRIRLDEPWAWFRISIEQRLQAHRKLSSMSSLWPSASFDEKQIHVLLCSILNTNALTSGLLTLQLLGFRTKYSLYERGEQQSIILNEPLPTLSLKSALYHLPSYPHPLSALTALTAPQPTPPQPSPPSLPTQLPDHHQQHHHHHHHQQQTRSQIRPNISPHDPFFSSTSFSASSTSPSSPPRHIRCSHPQPPQSAKPTNPSPHQSDSRARALDVEHFLHSLRYTQLEHISLSHPAVTANLPFTAPDLPRLHSNPILTATTTTTTTIPATTSTTASVTATATPPSPPSTISSFCHSLDDLIWTPSPLPTLPHPRLTLPQQRELAQEGLQVLHELFTFSHRILHDPSAAHPSRYNTKECSIWHFVGDLGVGLQSQSKDTPNLSSRDSFSTATSSTNSVPSDDLDDQDVDFDDNDDDNDQAHAQNDNPPALRPFLRVRDVVGLQDFFLEEDQMNQDLLGNNLQPNVFEDDDDEQLPRGQEVFSNLWYNWLFHLLGHTVGPIYLQSSTWESPDTYVDPYERYILDKTGVCGLHPDQVPPGLVVNPLFDLTTVDDPMNTVPMPWNIVTPQ